MTVFIAASGAGAAQEAGDAGEDVRVSYQPVSLKALQLTDDELPEDCRLVEGEHFVSIQAAMLYENPDIRILVQHRGLNRDEVLTLHEPAILGKFVIGQLQCLQRHRLIRDAHVLTRIPRFLSSTCTAGGDEHRHEQTCKQ